VVLGSKLERMGQRDESLVASVFQIAAALPFLSSPRYLSRFHALRRDSETSSLGGSQPVALSETPKMVFSRGALVGVGGKGRAPHGDAKAPHTRHDGIDFGINRLKRWQMWHARRVPLARSETHGFKVRPQRSAGGKEDITHVGVAVDWRRLNREGRQRGDEPLVGSDQEHSIIGGHSRKRRRVAQQASALLDLVRVEGKFAWILSERVLYPPQGVGSGDKPLIIVVVRFRVNDVWPKRHRHSILD
jgi:hypothetical protein